MRESKACGRPPSGPSEAKPSITPRDAVASAGRTLTELFGLARELNVEAEGIEIGPSPAEADHIAAFGLPIDDLDLTVRSYNCLKREGIHTVGELIGRSEQDLLDIRNFGAKSIDEVEVKLAGLGLALKGETAPAAEPADEDEGDDAEDEHGRAPPSAPGGGAVELPLLTGRAGGGPVRPSPSRPVNPRRVASLRPRAASGPRRTAAARRPSARLGLTRFSCVPRGSAARGRPLRPPGPHAARPHNELVRPRRRRKAAKARSPRRAC